MSINEKIDYLFEKEDITDSEIETLHHLLFIKNNINTIPDDGISAHYNAYLNARRLFIEDSTEVNKTNMLSALNSLIMVTGDMIETLYSNALIPEERNSIEQLR